MRREGMLQLALKVIPLNGFQDSIAQNSHLQSPTPLWKGALRNNTGTGGNAVGLLRLSISMRCNSSHLVAVHLQNEMPQHPVWAAMLSNTSSPVKMHVVRITLSESHTHMLQKAKISGSMTTHMLLRTSPEWQALKRVHQTDDTKH